MSESSYNGSFFIGGTIWHSGFARTNIIFLAFFDTNLIFYLPNIALVNKNWTRDSKNMSQKMGCGTTHADVLTGYDESSCKTSATLDSAPRNALEVLPTVRNS